MTKNTVMPRLTPIILTNQSVRSRTLNRRVKPALVERPAESMTTRDVTRGSAHRKRGGQASPEGVTSSTTFIDRFRTGRTVAGVINSVQPIATVFARSSAFRRSAAGARTG